MAKTKNNIENTIKQEEEFKKLKASKPNSISDLNDLAQDLFGKPYIDLNDAQQETLMDYISKRPTQLELPLDNPNDNIILFPVPENSPINNWYKTNIKNFKNKRLASADDLGPYLSQYYSKKQLSNMSEKEILSALDELLEAGVL